MFNRVPLIHPETGDTVHASQAGAEVLIAEHGYTPADLCDVVPPAPEVEEVEVEEEPVEETEVEETEVEDEEE